MELCITDPADFHCHLRQGNLMRLVTPHVRQGGFNLAYVMPNLSPPILTVEDALAYKQELQDISPDTQFLMTLFLSPSLTRQEIIKAKQHGIVGVKSYPRGVTTGSETGVESYSVYDQVFDEMQRQDLVLNLHGELPFNDQDETTVLNAEPRFLQHLIDLHTRFPRLRIVLEHATTKEAIDTVSRLGPTVACSITAHHLFLTINDWAGQPLHYCKPVAKSFSDRTALRQAIISASPKFFLGSDSAPHPFSNKMPSLPLTSSRKDLHVDKSCTVCAAGVYTSPYLLPLVAHAFESISPEIPLDRLQDFCSSNGRRFYGFPADPNKVVKLRKTAEKVVPGFRINVDTSSEGDWVIPFRATQDIGWAIVK